MLYLNVHLFPKGKPFVPLMVACEKGHTNIAKILLQNGGARSLQYLNKVRHFILFLTHSVIMCLALLV